MAVRASHVVATALVAAWLLLAPAVWAEEAWKMRLHAQPLRYENITDEEVAEIQFQAQQVMPGAIVNISGVTLGCPCEDGPWCTEQASIVAYRPERSAGLTLSRVQKKWTIGRLQTWRLRSDALTAKLNASPLSPNRAALAKAQQEMQGEYPACEAKVEEGANDVPPEFVYDVPTTWEEVGKLDGQWRKRFPDRFDAAARATAFEQPQSIWGRRMQAQITELVDRYEDGEINGRCGESICAFRGNVSLWGLRNRLDGDLIFTETETPGGDGDIVIYRRELPATYIYGIGKRLGYKGVMRSASNPAASRP